MTGKVQYIESGAYITGKQTITGSAYIESDHHSIKSDAIIKKPETTILCDGSIVNEIIEEFGTTVIIRKMNRSVSSSDDPYYTGVVGYSDYKRTVLIQQWTANDFEVIEGNYKAGEVTFVFEVTDKDLAVPGNKVLYAGQWYEIYRVLKHPMRDTLYMIEVRVKRV